MIYEAVGAECFRRAGRRSLRHITVHHVAALRVTTPIGLSPPPMFPYLDSFIGDREIDVWIHEHIHESRDYRTDNTPIVVDPRGYRISIRNIIF